MLTSRRWLPLISAVAVAMASALCSAEDGQRGPVDKVIVKAGQDEVGCPGDVIRLQVELLGPVERGMLGGKGERRPVANQLVSFSILDSAASDSTLVGAAEAITDAGGKASCAIKLGKEFGDRYVEAETISSDGRRRRAVIRVISGVKMFGNHQEASAGSTLPEPLAVQVLNADGAPVKDIPVFFGIEGNAPGAALSDDNVLTDIDGMAKTFLKLPPRTQKVKVTAEVADPQRRFVARGIRFTSMSVSTFLLVATLVGGLALFIFGMKQMSEGLQRVAGEKMKLILRMFTRNRFVAIITGALVTGVIQSSSACTVMTVGFVNAGLMTLRQAIGVVFGANIGTTVTGQIISFKITDVAYPAIALGFVMLMLSKSRTKKAYGEAMMGFGMLFLGLMLMSDTLKPLGDCRWFVDFFRSFNCAPVNGMMPIKSVLCSIFIGAALTVLIQSSSATIGLTIALAGTGLLDFWTAMPIVLGDNIGTTTTALLASIGANRPARRTALAHSLFNVFGTLYMITLFYVPAWWGGRRPFFLEIVNAFTSGDVFAELPVNIERHIANAHTLFNVFNVILFIPLVGILERACVFIIPRIQEEDQRTYLEPHLLSQPAIALEQATKELGYMANLSLKAISESYKLLRQFDPAMQEKLNKREDNIDRLQAEITDYIAKISQRELNDEQSKMLAPLMHAVNDAERIGDHAENLFELAQLRHSKKLAFSDSALDELDRMFETVQQQFMNVLQAIDTRDTEYANKALKLEEAINELDRELHDGHVSRLEAGACSCQAGVVFLDMVANLEKVGDHLTNIAERVRLVIDLSPNDSLGEAKA